MLKLVDKKTSTFLGSIFFVSIWTYGIYSKTCVKLPLSKRPKNGFQDRLWFNAGQKYCRMLQVEHSAILSTFIELPFVIKIIVLSIFDWPFYTGFKYSCMYLRTLISLIPNYFLLIFLDS